MATSREAASVGGRGLASAAAPETENEKKWAELLSGRQLKGTSRTSISDVRVNTLLTTSWRQSGSNGENYYTPPYGTGDSYNYVCGCVATAGAQIMYYWMHPTDSVALLKNYTGTVTIDGTDYEWTVQDGYKTSANSGYTPWGVAFGGTYNWAGMTSNDSTTKKQSIGKLTLDVGRSVHMGYSNDGSGSHYSLLATRLTDQFQYKNAALIIKKDGCSLDEIKKAILPSLDLKSPCGVSVPGHAIVADGYGYNNGTLYVHFNMGWGGTDNAWYNPPDLTDARTKYTSIDSIIYNVYPPRICSDSGRTIVSGRLLSNTGAVVANTTVTARNRSSGATYTATTDSKGIYALLVPAANYTISATKDNCTTSTNLTVAACVSTRLANDTGSSYYPNSPTPVIGNIHGVELTLNQLPAPTFSRANTVTDTTIFDGYVNLTISSSVSGAAIRYTLDGSDPTSSSAVYSGALQISSTCTVKARTFKSGYLESDVAEITFNKLSPTGDLILNGGFEQNTVAQNSGAWSYSNGDGFSCKYWTFASSAGLAAPNSTWVANHSVFGGKAAFLQTNGTGSESFVEQQFVIPNAATYTFTFTYAARPNYNGVTTRALLIRGSVTNEIASVSPTATSPSEYVGLVSVDSGATHVLRFVQSGVSGDKANIIDNVTFQKAVIVAAPVFSPKSGTVFFKNNQPVTLACATDGAEIRYTTDGSAPTASSPLYEGAFSISSNATIRARAFKVGCVASEVVSATYNRRALIGENLVEDTSPVVGETQTLRLPVAGGYAVSFTYAGGQGRGIELCLAQGGETNMLVSLSAASNGTFSTNVTFDVASAGDWELFVRNPASAATSPLTVSNLSISIPGTEENRRAYWIYETERTFGSTGRWNEKSVYRDGKITVDGLGLFTANTVSDGRLVTIFATTSFSSQCEDDRGVIDAIKAAVRIGKDAESGGNVFQALTGEGGSNVWVEVGAEGLEEPSLNVPYTFKFVLDCTNKTYTVLLVNGETETPLTNGASGIFTFGDGSTSAPVYQIGFSGDGSVESLYGEYGNPAEFMAGEGVRIDGGTTNITARQAAWLNSMNDYEVVRAKAGMLGTETFRNAYLLNLDIRGEFGMNEFAVTGIEVTGQDVNVYVTLIRTGAIDAAINGTLTLYGGSTLGELEPLAETPVTNGDFAAGDTAVFTYPRNGEAKFFRSVIK